MEEKNPIQVADRLFLVIETLANTGSIGLLELSKKLNLNKSTVHRILNSLIYMGYVKQDITTLKYSLSFKLCEIANQILTQIDIVNVAKPYLKQLVEQTNETVHLVQIDGVNGVYIDKVESSYNSVRLVSKVGKSIPLYCSGVGKALLAEMDSAKVKEIWDNSSIMKYTEHTITDYNQFLIKLEEIRRIGYAIDDEENELGVRCIATALKDYTGRAKYAISISAPATRMSDNKIMELSQDLIKTTENITSEWKL